MIKKTYRKNIFREVTSTLNRFIAIFAITALGAGFFAGLKATGGDMRNTGDVYFAEQKLMDFQLLSTFGFTDEDITALRELPEVDHVMPTYSLDLLMTSNENTAETVKIFALPDDTNASNPDYLNQVVLKDGRLPTAANECVVDSLAGTYKIGDTFTVSSSNDADSADLLAETTFTVVGIAESPYYISTTRGNTTIGDGTLTLFLYVPESSFNSEYYTCAFVTMKNTSGLSAFSTEYVTNVDNDMVLLENFGDKRTQIRYDEIIKEATDSLNNAKQELADAKTEAYEKLDEAAQTIADSEKEIADGKAEVAANEKKLIDGQKEIDANAEKLASARAQLESGQAEYDANLKIFNEKKAQYDTAKAQIETSLASAGEMQTAITSLSPLPDQIAALDTAISQLEQLETAGTITDEQKAQLEELKIQRSTAAEGFNSGITSIIVGIRSFADGIEAQGQTESAASLRAAAAQAEALVSADDTASQNSAITILEQTVLSIQTSLNAAKDELDEALPELEAGQTALNNAKATLDSGWSELNSGQIALNNAQADINSGKAEITKAKQTLADGEAKLANGKAEYDTQKADAEKEFADADAEIAKNQQKIEDIEKPAWYVTDRTSNSGYTGLKDDSERIDAIAQMFPLFFFLVAALVCLTTMTRMVEDQRTQIGTLKALGFNKASIAFKYIFYASTASLSGAIVGVIAGFLIFPGTIWSAYRIMYLMPPVTRADHTSLAVAGVLLSVFCTTISTIWACYSELRSVPSELMRPKAPKPGKRVLLERIPFIWKRISFSNKLTIRNLFRYKKRFFMTVIGVAGCTALLVTGFGLRDSITGIAGQQYGVIEKYNIMVYMQDPSNKNADTELNRKLNSLGNSMYISQDAITVKTTDVSSNGMTVNAFTFEEPENVDTFIHFQNRKTQEPIALPTGNEVIITEKLSSKLGISVGDSIEIGRTDSEMISVTVSGISENYLLNYVYMQPSTYKEMLGKEVEYSTVLLNLNDSSDANISATLTNLIDTDNVMSAIGTDALVSQIDDMLGSLNKVLWVIVLAAALLAIVVLYNLTNINITERSREIATLKVLGFYDNEVSSYIFRENFVLTLISIVVGLVMGVFLHRYVITTAEIDQVMFMRTVKPLSYVFAGVFTILSNIIVSLIMMPKLKKINMIESLKSSE